VRTEDLGGEFDLLDAPQYPRAELHIGEGLRIGGEGAFILGPTVDVIEAATGKAPLGDSAEVGD
jgi:hypothetical protein